MDGQKSKNSKSSNHKITKSFGLLHSSSETRSKDMTILYMSHIPPAKTISENCSKICRKHLKIFSHLKMFLILNSRFRNIYHFPQLNHQSVASIIFCFPCILSLNFPAPLFSVYRRNSTGSTPLGRSISHGHGSSSAPIARAPAAQACGSST